MKKKIYAFNKAVFILFASFAMARTASAQVGVGTTSPVASAQLQIDATNKGILIPRVLKASRPLSPANGLLIYQTDDTAGFYFYKSNAWNRLASADEIIPATPAVSNGCIVPFASGLPSTMTTVLGGMMNTSSIVGFGNSASGISKMSGTIDLTGAAGTLLNFAFTVPRAGTITSLSAQFSSTAAVALVGSTITLTAQVYSAAAGSNTFSVVPGAVVYMAPPLTGILSLGTTSYGTTTGLSIPVTAGTRLLLVYSADVTAGIDMSTTIAGYTSGGININ